MTTGSGLPARDLADVQLARHLDGLGCPVCKAGDRAVSRFLDAWLYEGVQDVQRRAELDRARGLCGAHTRALLTANRERGGGQLGTAILLEAILAVRLPELRAAHAARGRLRNHKVAVAARPPACPVCIQATRATDDATSGLLAHAHEPAWAAAIGTADVCLPHLLGLMTAGGSSQAWHAIETRQLDRLKRLGSLARDYAHHQAEDRRHLLTDEQSASVARLVDLLAGPD
jgi:hypothetical protein